MPDCVIKRLLHAFDEKDEEICICLHRDELKRYGKGDAPRILGTKAFTVNAKSVYRMSILIPLCRIHIIRHRQSHQQF